MVTPKPPVVEPASDRELREQLEQARAERDAAVQKLAAQNRRTQIGGGIRRTFVAFLVFLVAILVPITVTTVWVRHTVFNTDNYVKTVAPIAEDPAVTAAAARIATDQLFAALDPQQKIAEALPPKAAFLAAPITSGVKGFVQDKTNAILNTAQFQQIWTNANRTAHEELVKVLKGNSKAVQTTNGEVVLNLVPLLNEVLKSVQQQASALLNKNITLPTLSGNELPSVACQKLSTALNRPLPATCGQIPLFPADKLDNAQRAVRLFNALVITLLIATPLLAALALWLTRRHRRTLLQLTVGFMLATVVLRRAVMWLQNTLIATGKPENEAARSAIVHQLLHGFFTTTIWLLWIGVAILVLAVITGPYPWMVASRHWLRSAAGTVAQWTRVGFGHARTATSNEWIPAHLDLLRIAGAALALLLILVFSLSFWGVLIVLALTAAYELWLHQIGLRARREADTAAVS